MMDMTKPGAERARLVRFAGNWSGEEKLFEKNTPRGEARYAFQFGGDYYDFRIENRFPGQPEFVVFMQRHCQRER